MRRRVEIILEVEQVTVARRAGPEVRAWCGACGREVSMVTPERAAALARRDTRAVYRWVEAGLIHFTERPAQTLLICARSVTAGPAAGPGRSPLDETETLEGIKNDGD